MTTSLALDNFVKADSRNLPSVEMIMILEYMTVNNNHNIAEIRGAKALLTSRDSYVDSAVGYVELKRVSGVCYVRAKVVPEHKLGKLYNVSTKINESEDIITEAMCEDCAAAAGGCKHSLLLLFWLVKRSNEESSTSFTCYWTKPKLSSARTEAVQTKAIFKNPKKKIRLCSKNPAILESFFEECESRQLKDSMILCFNKQKKFIVNVFDLAIEFKKEQTDHSFEIFFDTINNKITGEIKKIINMKTMEQANCSFWHNVRQGRITASKLYEAAHCTTDGSLVQQILGGYKVPDTAAIRRGRKLESKVIQELEKRLKIVINKSGFLLINAILGASPDGITDDFVVEVKCPMTQKSLKTYIKDNKVSKKFKAQIQCQMMAANKLKGLFCVADPSFEMNKKIHVYWVKYDKSGLDSLIEKSLQFWEMFIYPKILASVME